MKKVLILFSAVVLGFILVGCTKKSGTTATTTTTTPAATGSAQTTADSGSDAESQASTTPTDTSSSSSSQSADGEKTYADNLKSATTAAQTVFKNTAKFCTTYIEIDSGENINNATQSFFFTSDSQKDWYWIEQFDQLLKKQRHLFAVKNSYKDEVECTSLKDSDIKLSYIAAYQRIQETGSVPSGDILEIIITLRNNSWRVSFVDSNGQVTAKEIDATNAFVSTPSATATASK